MSRTSMTFKEMFGTDAACLAAMLHLVSLTKGFEEGPFKAGFESAIEEVGAFLDSEVGDDGMQCQTLMEQMLGLINGSYALVEMPRGPIGSVAPPAVSNFDQNRSRNENGNLLHEHGQDSADLQNGSCTANSDAKPE